MSSELRSDEYNDSTLPPTSREDLLAEEGATLYVFSHDANLAGVIKTVAADHYPIRVIDKWPDLIQVVGSGGGRIILLDVDAMTGSVDTALQDLNRCTDWLVIVIAAKQQQAQNFMRFWSERRIHRLLIKPAAVGITRLLLESAVARFVELRELHENTDSMEIPPQLLQDSANESRRWWKYIAGIVAIGAVAAGLYFSGLFSNDEDVQSSGVRPIAMAPTGQRSPEPTQSSQDAASNAQLANEQQANLNEGDSTLDSAQDLGAAVDPVNRFNTGESEVLDSDAAGNNAAAQALPNTIDAVPSPVDATGSNNVDNSLTNANVPDPFAELLTRAATAESLGRVYEPLGLSALDDYLEILDSAPDHELALLKRSEIVESLFAIAETHLLNREFELVDGTLAHIRRAAPGSSRLGFLNEQLAQSRAAALVLEDARAAASVSEQAAESPPVTPAPPVVQERAAPSELESMILLAELRLTQSALVEPSGDSALDYWLRATEIDVENTAVVGLRSELLTAIVDAAIEQFDAGNLSQAERLHSTAIELGDESPRLLALGPQIQNAVAAESQREIADLSERALISVNSASYTGSEDSTIFYRRELIARNAPESVIERIDIALTDAVSRDVREAIAGGNWNAAAEYLSILDTDISDTQTIASLRHDLMFSQRQSGYLANVAPVGELSIVSAVPPVYPRNALLNEVTGWVELQFTVGVDGQTRDIVVVAAEPQGLFDQAASNAVTNYTFVPFEFEGDLYERRVRIKINFALD